MEGVLAGGNEELGASEEFGNPRCYTVAAMRLRLSRSWIWLMLLVPLATAAQEAAPADTDTVPPEIPKFYAESRQILIEAQVWEKGLKKGETPWIGNEPLTSPEKDVIQGLSPAARGLGRANFHVFDDGVEQTINYFKETDLPAFDNTNHWYLVPSVAGTWGIYDNGRHYGPPEASYLIGYAPPRSAPGQCRTLKVAVDDHDVYINRDRYCVRGSDFDDIEALAGKKIGSRMRDFAKSSKRGTIDVTLHASIFWSSGVLSVLRETLPSADTSAVGTHLTYVVEVHDSKAPATVQTTAGFDFHKWWDYPCMKNAAVYILGIAYKENGDVAGQFGDTYSCNGITRYFEHYHATPMSYVYIPLRFDSQLSLRPGDYELAVVVTDGGYFGKARMPLHVGALDPQHLAISDIAVAGIVRYAGWVLREAAAVNPSPVVPSPLVSKDSQYFPDSDKEIRLRKHTPLYFYFEIYEPQLRTQEKGPSYRWRITNQKSGAVVLNSEPISAVDWIVRGSAVVPIGLKIDADKLPKGNYKLEVQASDSAGHESEWKQASFVIK